MFGLLALVAELMILMLRVVYHLLKWTLILGFLFAKLMWIGMRELVVLVAAVVAVVIAARERRAAEIRIEAAQIATSTALPLRPRPDPATSEITHHSSTH